ncbi:MAG: hypothetical protein WBC74_02170 [Candidatus Omnitrophota bacterium]
MRIKQTSTLVIIISSSVIVAVLALTLFGFYAYLEWKEQNIRKNYRIALYDLNARVFGKYILINLQAKFGTEGASRGRPVVEGTVKNTSNKKIYSLKLKVSFCDPKRQVVYVEGFYPVGTEPESLVNIGGITENFLKENDSISFKHQLKNCPQEVNDYLKAKSKFSKLSDVGRLSLVYKIEGLDIK